MFFILSTYRTGSTLLATALNSHPRIICESEILNKNTWINRPPFDSSEKLRFLDVLDKNEGWQNRVYLTNNITRCEKRGPCGFGAMLKYQHLNKDVVNYLNHKGSRLMFVTRKDIVRRELSYLLARAIRQRSNMTESIHYTEEKRIDPVTFTQEMISNLKKRIRETQNIDAEYMGMFDPKNIMVFRYEDLTGNDSVSAIDARISYPLCDFLHVDRMILTSEIIKNKNAQPETAIANWREVKQQIKDM